MAKSMIAITIDGKDIAAIEIDKTAIANILQNTNSKTDIDTAAAQVLQIASRAILQAFGNTPYAYKVEVEEDETDTDPSIDSDGKWIYPHDITYAAFIEHTGRALIELDLADEEDVESNGFDGRTFRSFDAATIDVKDWIAYLDRKIDTPIKFSTFYKSIGLKKLRETEFYKIIGMFNVFQRNELRFNDWTGTFILELNSIAAKPFSLTEKWRDISLLKTFDAQWSLLGKLLGDKSQTEALFSVIKDFTVIDAARAYAWWVISFENPDKVMTVQQTIDKIFISACRPEYVYQLTQLKISEIDLGTQLNIKADIWKFILESTGQEANGDIAALFDCVDAGMKDVYMLVYSYLH